MHVFEVIIVNNTCIIGALKSELSVIERPSLQNQVIDHNSTIEKPTGKSKTYCYY